MIKAGHQQIIKGYDGGTVDTFNCGIILFCLAFKRMPFERAVGNDQFYKFIIVDNAENFWQAHRSSGVDVDAVSENCRQLIFGLLYRQPDLRPSLLDVLADPWFEEVAANKMWTQEKVLEDLGNRRAYMK